MAAPIDVATNENSYSNAGVATHIRRMGARVGQGLSHFNGTCVTMHPQASSPGPKIIMMPACGSLVSFLLSYARVLTKFLSHLNTMTLPYRNTDLSCILFDKLRYFVL